MSTAAAVKAEVEAMAPRKLPPIDPAFCEMNSAGTVFREWVVRLPESYTFGDWHSFNWSRVQSAGLSRSLWKGDRVRIVSYDEAWVVDGVIVCHATMEGVRLSKPTNKIDYDPIAGLYEDDKHAVKWCGIGYSVVRKSDGMEVCAPVQNLATAIANLHALYPKKLSGRGIA